MAEEFQKVQPQVRVTVGIAGTSGGFKRFTVGETDIRDASRPIDPTEADAAWKNNIRFIEPTVEFDGISVMVNPANDFVSTLTVEELKRIWEPASKMKRWSDVKRGWPPRAIPFYGPRTDSGTFDYFSEVINVQAASRPEGEAFVKFLLDPAKTLVAEVGYVPLPDTIYALARRRFEWHKLGSVFANQGTQVGITLESLLQSEQ